MSRIGLAPAPDQRVARNLLLKAANSRLGGGMLWTFFVTLLFLWCVGLATSVTLSGFIHLLPIMAAVVALLGTIQRRQLI
jgi:hypothetical protein